MFGSALHFLGNLYNHAANTVHNDVVQPIHLAARTILNPPPSPNAIPITYTPPKPGSTTNTLPRNQVRAFANNINQYHQDDNGIYHYLPTAGKAAPVAFNTLSLSPTHNEQIAPPSQIKKGAAAIRADVSEYGLKPNFINTLNQANPAIGNSAMQNAGLLHGQAAGEYSPMAEATSPTRINLAPLGPATSNALTHEGLHRVFQLKPDQRNKFINAYNQSSTPDLKSYLADRLSEYKAFRNRPNLLNNLAKAPFSIQTEVHSYIPEYYKYQMAEGNGTFPQPLKNYYSQYYQPDLTAARTRAFLDAMRLLHPNYLDSGDN